MHYLSQYQISAIDACCHRLRLTDAYSLHRIVYDLFDDVRNGDDDRNKSSGILFADKGMKPSALKNGSRQHMRTVLILSNRAPHEPQYGILHTKPLPDTYLQAPHYAFEVIINPVRRNNIGDSRGPIVPIRGKAAVRQWFLEKSPGWGFETHEPSLQVGDINVAQFPHKGSQTTIAQATVTGTLHVADRALFTQSVHHGIGRAKAFGCGLLQIVPIA